MTIAVERHALGIEPGSEGGVDRDETRISTRSRFEPRGWPSQCLLASAFMSSGSEDVIVDAQALTGAVGMTLMTFFFPSVLVVALLPEGAVSARERRRGRGGRRRRRRRRRRRGGGRQRGRLLRDRGGGFGGLRAREAHVRAARSGGSVLRQRAWGGGPNAAGSNCEESTAASVVSCRITSECCVMYRITSPCRVPVVARDASRGEGSR